MEIFEGFNLIDAVISVLPKSPFAPYIAQFSNLPFLGYLNWFFPVRECVIVMAAWLGAVLLYYVYSVVARWIKLIGD